MSNQRIQQDMASYEQNPIYDVIQLETTSNQTKDDEQGYEMFATTTKNDSGNYPDMHWNVSYVYNHPTNKTDTLLKADFDNTKRALKTTRKCVITMAFLLVLLLLMTLAAIALAVFSCIAVRGLNNIIHHQIATSTSEEYTNIQGLTIELSQIQSKIETLQLQVTSLHSQLNRSQDEFVNVFQKGFFVRICGPGLWHRVAYLFMGDPSQHCPTAWREYNTSGVRACGRSDSNIGSCSATSYPTSRNYGRVCGRVIGYQFGSPDAFAGYARIERLPVDGVSIFHGIPSSHIWSYVGGISQVNNPSNSQSKCPCNVSSSRAAAPSTIGNNYYCESGAIWINNHLYLDDKLWDGLQCEGTCCAGTRSPPWFSVQLPASTNDAIEIQICGDESTYNEDTPVELIEIFVQ